MTDDTEQTEAAPSMTERIRNTQAERRRAGYERLFAPRGDTATDTDPLPDDDGDA